MKNGEDVVFDASSSYGTGGTIVSYLFDYGDSSNSGWITNPRPRHAYVRSGQYEARVKVKDIQGVESDWSAPVTINVIGVEITLFNAYDDQLVLLGFLAKQLGLLPFASSINVQVDVYVNGGVPEKVDLILNNAYVEPLWTRKLSSNHYVFKVLSDKLLSVQNIKDMGFYAGVVTVVCFSGAAELGLMTLSSGTLAAIATFKTIHSIDNAIDYLVATTQKDAYLTGVKVSIGGRELTFSYNELLPTAGNALLKLKGDKSAQGKIGYLLMKAYGNLVSILLDSPAHIALLDENGHLVAGALYVNGTLENETLVGRFAIYTGRECHPEAIILLNGSSRYRVVVYEIGEGAYNLTISCTQGNNTNSQSFYETAKQGKSREYGFEIPTSGGGRTINFMPMFYNVSFPKSIVYGDKVEASMNISDPEGVRKVEVSLLDRTRVWYNSTASYSGGLYWVSIPTFGFPIGAYSIHVIVTDTEGFQYTGIYDLRILGRLVLSAKISKSEVVSGEPVSIAITLRDQDENPVKFASVSVVIDGKLYDVHYAGGENYPATVDTNGLEGSYVVRINASKQGFASAQNDLSLIVRPWWWPYLPYAGVVGLAFVAISVAYLLRPKKPPISIKPVEDGLIKLLREANELLEKGEYAKAVESSAQGLREGLIDSLKLSRSVSTEELISKVSSLRKDLDARAIREILELGDRCAYAGYKPSKEEARRATEASEKNGRGTGQVLIIVSLSFRMDNDGWTKRDPKNSGRP